MATIKVQSELIIAHPYFADCLEKAQTGDMSGFQRLFIEVQAHCWEKVALQASRTYGTWHRGNHMDIKRELRNLAPPETLDLRLPIPPPKEKIQLIVPITQKRHKLRVVITNQLLIPFPENIVQHLKIA